MKMLGKSMKICTLLLMSLWANQIALLECNTITTERSLVEKGLRLSSYESYEGATCENKLSLGFCERIVSSNSCPGLYEDSPLKTGCQRSCGFCQDTYETESEEVDYKNRALANNDDLYNDGGCEDKIPNCSGYLSLCCSMKEAMNTSCPKTCKFCSETPSAPGAPGGIAAPTASTGQDPCGSTDPPSVTVDAPAPGQTTTTQASITAATLPGISIDVPGQTTTTTQSSIPGSGNVPGNPVG